MCQAALFWNKHGRILLLLLLYQTRAFVNDKNEKEHKIPPAYLLNVPKQNKKKTAVAAIHSFFIVTEIQMET